MSHVWWPGAAVAVAGALIVIWAVRPLLPRRRKRGTRLSRQLALGLLEDATGRAEQNGIDDQAGEAR